VKKARLDQILLRMGAVTEEQIRTALLRQKSRGGKLGSHLLYYRFVTEDQMVQALAEQFAVSGVRLSRCEIPEDVVKRIPVKIAEDHVALPFRFDREKGELHVAIADPGDAEALSMLRRTSGAPRVILYIAPESRILSKIASLYHGRADASSRDHVIDLPDLFEDEKEKRPARPAEPEKTGEKAPPRAGVLLFTGQLFLKNVLPSVFEREGVRLSVATSADQIVEALKAVECGRVLVSEDVREEFERFLSGPGSRVAVPEATYFRTVANALLENPVPYEKMFESLLAAVRRIAGPRQAGLTGSPPYALISKEIAEVGRGLGLGRIVVDGLRIAAHLLTPPIEGENGAAASASGPGANLFGDLDASILVARSLEFPWDIAACLQLLGMATPAAGGASSPEEERRALSTAAGLLALVWYRHQALPSLRGGSAGDPETLKSGLRAQAGRLASSSVVEAYVRALEQSDAFSGAGKDIVLVGEADPRSSNLVMELKQHGFRVAQADDLAEARKICLRRRPAAIVLRVDESLSDADAFCRFLREEERDADTVLFAVTQRSEPSFLLNLMDTWFSDVFTLPMNGQVVVARISRALSGREKGSGGPAGHGFSATFKDLSFVDLVQALGTGGKNVRMRIEHVSGVQADICFRQGRIVSAECGEEKGVDAVYRVICWQDAGNFRVEPIRKFPADNVSVPTDYILLEGSRRLDEHRAGR
jgi:CheY-like chemotaxis protein